MKIAVIHEWLTRWAGSEQVLAQLLSCLPTADLFALTCCPDADGKRHLAGRTIHTSWAQKLPLAKQRPQAWLPLLPMAARSLDLRGYDLVVSNSHCVAKGVVTDPEAIHVSYIHTPMRYAWDLRAEYAARVPWLIRPLWNLQMQRMRAWEQRVASGIDAIATNSRYIAQRIERAWQRSATVVPPPVDIASFTLHAGDRDDFYITASRLVPYKKVSLIVESFTHMPEKRLQVIGDGPDLARVKSMARCHKNITILGHVAREELIERVRQARGFVFAAEEDFGIAPVEAQSCGTPVIAFGRGGATETVVDGVTGVFFSEQSCASLIGAINRFEGMSWSPTACRQQAEKFSPAEFRAGFMQFLRQTGAQV